MATEGRRWVDRPVRKVEDYGAPLKCPNCPPKHYFGWLWLPNLKAPTCPNCHTRLASVPRRRDAV